MNVEELTMKGIYEQLEKNLGDIWRARQGLLSDDELKYLRWMKDDINEVRKGAKIMKAAEKYKERLQEG